MVPSLGTTFVFSVLFLYAAVPLVKVLRSSASLSTAVIYLFVFLLP